MKSGGAADKAKLARLDELGSHLVTPPVRYSKPELLTHITYLYSMTNLADQRPGRDAIARLLLLRKQLDARKAELDTIVGPSM